MSVSVKERDTESVLGIDVGFSEKLPTTCFCLLQYDSQTIRFRFRLAGVGLEERRNALHALVTPQSKLNAVAIDGPLTHGLRIVDHYRAAEALLSLGEFQRRGKPGQTSSPTGKQLHRHATQLAGLVLQETRAGHLQIEASTHYQPLHESAIVEAFPNQFLAALIPEAHLPALNRDASDRYWEVLVERICGLSGLLHHLLPGCKLDTALEDHTDHEHRAGIVCALTALSVCRRDYAGVGDPVDGDIILPSPARWATSVAGFGSWMEVALRTNVTRVRRSRRNHDNHRDTRVTTHSGTWF